MPRIYETEAARDRLGAEPMLIGVPKETKDLEFRVSVTPGGVREYVSHGHQVLVESAAGEGSGFSNAEYEAAGAEIVAAPPQVFSRAEMIVKVKEPTRAEY